MLEEILKIKKLREDDATAALAEARRNLEECVRVRDEAQAAADAFRARRPQLEDALFDEIKNQLVAMKGLDEVRDQVSALRAREFKLYEEVERRDQEVSRAEQRVSDAERQRLLAHRDVQKYEELQARQAALEAAEAERIQEAEVEDLLTAKRPN